MPDQPLIAGPKDRESPTEPQRSAAFAAVDAHTHPGRWLGDWVGRDGEWLVGDVARWLDEMALYNVWSFVNLDGRWGDELRANLERFDNAHPGRFATFCQIDWSLLAEPGASAAIVEQLSASAAVGAAGVKVWKDLGLTARDENGQLVLPDDQRLAPFWQATAELGLPVWWHVADPEAFFKPVTPANENYQLLRQRPDWSYVGKDYPSFGRLMESLEHVVASNPKTQFVAVHAGGHAEDPDHVGRLLSAYPNLHIDIAARLAQLGRRPEATRDLILRHPDRVLFGTDEIPPTGESYPTHFRFLETTDQEFPHSSEEKPLLGDWTISGLGLPPSILSDVYAGNALRLVSRLTPPPFAFETKDAEA